MSGSIYRSIVVPFFCKDMFTQSSQGWEISNNYCRLGLKSRPVKVPLICWTCQLSRELASVLAMLELLDLLM